MIYKKAVDADAVIIATLHKKGIPTGFLSKQSSSFLEALYSYLVKHEIVYIAKDEGKVVGFIAVSKNTSGLYKRFLKSHLGLLMRFTLQNIFSLEFIKKAFETLNAPKKTEIEDEKMPELLSIVVDNDYAGQGIGKALLKSAEEELLQSNHNRYKVLVGADLEANQFYIKNGFELLKEVELHKGIGSYIYVKSLIRNQ